MNLAILCLLLTIASSHGDVFSECGGSMDQEMGFIQSPNFPNRFQTPISCHWVIHAPPEKKIIIYFTQYFLREGFYLSEYDHYENEFSYAGKNTLGEINFEDEFTWLVAYKPFVVVNLNVRDHGNIHLRVEEYLQNVYGFNITYEIVDLERSVRKDTCSVHECSFLGNCVASSNYSEYRCDCFDKFFGDECQYGPFCDPDKGTNMCENGGKCRYFYGSLVNTCECPPGYVGSKCSTKTDKPLNQDCEKLGCSQLCEQSSSGSYYCACIEGYRLEADKATCREKEMFRITVQAPVEQGVVIPAGFTSEHIDVTGILERPVTSTLSLSGITSLKDFGFDGIRTKADRRWIVFHFYIENTDLHLVNRGLRFLTIGNELFGVAVNTTEIAYQADPEMKLLGVDNYGRQPAIEGKLLTLMCTARGSEQMKFRWYKDDSLLNTTLSQRNAWELRIPKTIKNKQISVLNINGVQFYDKGKFMCAIEDFGISDNTSVIVDVITIPLLEMSPLAVSLTKGQSTSFRCLSPDDTIEKGSFSYQWLKNDRPIPHDSVYEVVEDVFPTGRRLHIRNGQHDANYTCKITNQAGSTNKTAYLFVKEEDDVIGYCPEDLYEGVTWVRTFGGCFDVQRCPTDKGGYSRRWCNCGESGCNWTKPNFVKCQSGHLIIIFDRLEKIKLGYQHERLGSIWEDLYGLIRQARGRLYAGDVDVSSSILHTLVKTLVHYPSLAPDNGSFSLMNLLDFTNILLAEALLTTKEEKESIYVGPKVMQIAEIICGLHLPSFKFYDGLSIANDKIVVEMKQLRVIPPNTTVPALPSYEETTVVEVQTRSTRHRREKFVISPNGKYAHKEPAYISEVMFVYNYVNMYSLLHDNFAENIVMPDFITEIQSVFPTNNFYLGKRQKVEIIMDHPNHTILKENNETTCLSWRTTRKFVTDHDVLNGHWSTKDCDVIQRNMTSTTCWCDVPGHFVVIVNQINVTMPVVQERYAGVLIVGCVISMCGLVSTLAVYLFAWRNLIGDTHCIHLNFALTLAVINVICIVCLEKAHFETLCAAGKILIQFFYLAAFAFLFVEAVHMFVVVHARNRVPRSFLKYFLIGWGIPTLATGSVVVASEKYGYDESCFEWCWLSESHWHFYSFLVPAIVLVVAQLALNVISIWTVWGWKDEWRYKDRRKHMKNAAKSSTLQVLLSLSCVFGSLVEHPSQGPYTNVFFMADIILSWTVFAFYVLLENQIRLAVKYIFQKEGKPDIARKFSSRSFRAYMMPEKIDERGETIEESIHRHQSEINRNKFTRERKKQLENLLGSSSSENSTSASGSDTSRESQIRFLQTPVDSGISEEDASENCSIKNTLGVQYRCRVEIEGGENGADSIRLSPLDRLFVTPNNELPVVTVHSS